MDVETAHGMLAWPHSGFHVHDGVWVAAEDRAFAGRLARYCARNPVALSRLAYQQATSLSPTTPTRQPVPPRAARQWTSGNSCHRAWRCRLRCRLIPAESDFNYYSKEHVVRKFVHFMGF